MSLELTAVYLKAPEGGYVAFVEEIPGPNTRADGSTLEEHGPISLGEMNHFVLLPVRGLVGHDVS